MTDSVITRANARAAGLHRYFTGEPCPHGHVVERHVRSGGCVECLRLKNQRDRHLRRAWANSTHPAARARNRRKRQKWIAHRRGYCPAPHERNCPPRPLSGRCERCTEVAPAWLGKLPGRESLVLDHDHDTGDFRGWLCVGCNTGIERDPDDPLTKEYLTAPPF